MVRAALSLFAALLIGAQSPLAPPAILIRGAHVFDGTSQSSRIRDVLVERDRIVAIDRRIKAPRGTLIIDGGGQTLLPGLRDLHVHTGRGAFATPDALTRYHAGYLLSGVTAINDYSAPIDMLGTIRSMEASAVVPNAAYAARLGVPGGHGTETEFTDRNTTKVTTPQSARTAMSEVLKYRPDLIKVFADGWRYGRDVDRPDMDLPTLQAIAKEADRARLPVVSHTVTLAGAKRAARAGVDAIVHGIGDAPVDDELITLMKRHRMAYVPTMVVYEPQQDRKFSPEEWRLLRPAQQARETARMAAPRRPIPDYEAKRWTILQDNLRRLKAAGIPIGVGTDTGIAGIYAGAATLREIRWLTRLGLTPAEALTAATRINAGIMRDRSRGRIAVGQRADLLLAGGRPDLRIDDLFNVRRVFVGGREMPLDRLRDQAFNDGPR